MSGANDKTELSSTTSRRRDVSWLYLALFATQTIGVFILLWNGIPHYRQILADPASYEPRTQTLIWAFSSIALIQVGYWLCDRLRPPLPKFRNALVGTIILFLARMSFVFATSVFGVVFITQKPGLNIPLFRDIITIVGLFSLFCYVRELERLGRSLLGRER
jgi:hypothetical protein